MNREMNFGYFGFHARRLLSTIEILVERFMKSMLNLKLRFSPSILAVLLFIDKWMKQHQI